MYLRRVNKLSEIIMTIVIDMTHVPIRDMIFHIQRCIVNFTEKANPTLTPPPRYQHSYFTITIPFRAVCGVHELWGNLLATRSIRGPVRGSPPTARLFAVTLRGARHLVIRKPSAILASQTCPEGWNGPDDGTGWPLTGDGRRAAYGAQADADPSVTDCTIGT